MAFLGQCMATRLRESPWGVRIPAAPARPIPASPLAPRPCWVQLKHDCGAGPAAAWSSMHGADCAGHRCGAERIYAFERLMYARRSQLGCLERGPLFPCCAPLPGATSSIGRALCRALSGQGAHLILGCRSPEDGEQVIKELSALSPGCETSVLVCDLSSLRGAEAAAAAFKVNEQIRSA